MPLDVVAVARRIVAALGSAKGKDRSRKLFQICGIHPESRGLCGHCYVRKVNPATEERVELSPSHAQCRWPMMSPPQEEVNNGIKGYRSESRRCCLAMRYGMGSGWEIRMSALQPFGFATSNPDFSEQPSLGNQSFMDDPSRALPISV